MIRLHQAKGQANKKPNLAVQKRKQARDVAGMTATYILHNTAGRAWLYFPKK